MSNFEQALEMIENKKFVGLKIDIGFEKILISNEFEQMEININNEIIVSEKGSNNFMKINELHRAIEFMKI